MRYFKIQSNQATEGSLAFFLPNTSNPELLTPQELLEVGIYTLTEPAPVEGSRWIPIAPTWDGTALVGGWELQEIPPVVPEPDWDGFLAGFVFPGNGIYNGIATKVQAATPFTQEHWQNLRLILIGGGSLRTREAVIGGWEYLKLLLAADNQALADETVMAFESLAAANHILLDEESHES